VSGYTGVSRFVRKEELGSSSTCWWCISGIRVSKSLELWKRDALDAPVAQRLWRLLKVEIQIVACIRFVKNIWTMNQIALKVIVAWWNRNCLWTVVKWYDRHLAVFSTGHEKWEYGPFLSHQAEIDFSACLSKTSSVIPLFLHHHDWCPGRLARHNLYPHP
jgi:hypothetical protein